MQALEEKQLQLLMTYSQDLATVKDAFHYNKKAPILPKNAALHSGSIKWVRGLRERIDSPMDKIRALNRLVLDTEEARRMFEDHAALLKDMNEFEEEHVKAWVGQVSQVCSTAQLWLRVYQYVHNLLLFPVACGETNACAVMLKCTVMKRCEPFGVPADFKREACVKAAPFGHTRHK